MSPSDITGAAEERGGVLEGLVARQSAWRDAKRLHHGSCCAPQVVGRPHTLGSHAQY